MKLSTIGCIAAGAAGNYTLWRNGNNPHGYYFLGMYTADPSQIVWLSMYGYDMIFEDYILMQYANRVGQGAGNDAYLACEDAIDLSKYSAVEIVVENGGSSSITVSVGTVTGAEIGVEYGGMTTIGSSTLVDAGAQKTITVDLSSITGTAQPVIRVHTQSNRQPNARIYSWRLLR